LFEKFQFIHFHENKNPILILFLPVKLEQPSIISPLRLEVDVAIIIFSINVFITIFCYIKLFLSKYGAKIKNVTTIPNFFKLFL